MFLVFQRLSFNASNAPTGSDGNAKNTVVTIGKNIPLVGFCSWDTVYNCDLFFRIKQSMNL